MEKFLPYYDNYEVSNLGNVRRKIDGGYKELKCSIQNRGYRYFQQNKDGKRINHLVHHIVAKLFIGERPDELVIDHIDRNKLNNCVDNLRYVTQNDNMKNIDKYKTEIIETDPAKRKKLVDKLYVESNREAVLEKKRQYYQEHKEHILEQQSKKYPLKCDICNEIRYITKSSINRSIRIGVNTCKKCQAPINFGGSINN
jgi:hypothetical protein